MMLELKMKQEEFIFFINAGIIIVLVHTAHHTTATDIHAENSINCMGTSG